MTIPYNDGEPTWHNTTRVAKAVDLEEDELSELWDLDAPQQDRYLPFEVTLTYEIDLPTGEARIVRVGGVDLDEPVYIT